MALPKDPKKREEFLHNLRTRTIGRKHTPEELKRMSDSHKRRGTRPPLRTGPMSQEHRKKISEAHLKKVADGTHHLWKGGISTKNELARKSINTRIFREQVFERDNYTCQECGVRSGNGQRVNLHVDHIKPWAYFPDLRFSIENGRTLCVSCHHQTETYGSKCVALYQK